MSLREFNALRALPFYSVLEDEKLSGYEGKLVEQKIALKRPRDWYICYKDRLRAIEYITEENL